MAGIFFAAYYSYVRTELFTITSYDVQGVNDSTRKSIEVQLHKLATKSGFLGIPRNKIFTYNTTGMVEVVRQNIPDVATIAMRPVGLHKVIIQVTPLIPILRVSDTEAITEDGIIFSPTKDIHIYPIITIASSTKETIKINGLPFMRLMRSGQNVDAAFFQNILSVSTKVSSLIFPVESILVEESGDVSLFSGSTTSKVMFLKDADPKKVWSTIVSAIDTDPLKTKLIKNKSDLLYLDVRYGNKLFYRFNDDLFQNDKGAGILHGHASTSFSTSSPTR